MSLAQLETLSFSNSTTCGSLLDGQYWDTALKTSGNTTLHIIPNTVYGFTQSTNEWTSFFNQNMTNPPFWLTLGLNNYTSELETQLAARVMGTNNLTLAAAAMKNYTSLAAGLELAGVDFVSFGGLSGIKTYIATGNGAQAASATLPGQIYQLYTLSQDCSYPKEQRAQFFGEALAVTSLIVATSGKDGFGPKFEGLLSKVNLLDAWPKIKGYLQDVSTSSPATAYETTLVLEELAKKFPSTFGDLAPFTSDRIDLMVQALKAKGLTPEAIKEKVTELAQVADSATGDGDVAEAADEISYRETGTILARVDDNLHLNLYGGATTKRYIQQTFLEKEVPGFVASDSTAFKVIVHKGNDEMISYYVYQGGQNFSPTLPEGQAAPGDVVPISIELLPLDALLKGIPSFMLTNPAYLSWVADSVIVKDFSVKGDNLQIHIVQDNPFSTLKDFTIVGKVTKYPGSSTNYGGAYVEFTVSDYAGRTQTLRLRHDGFDTPAFQLENRGAFESVSLLSYDGLRLSIVYRSDNSVATVYVEAPTEAIYALSGMHSYSGHYLDTIDRKITNAFMIDHIETVRGLESAMLRHGSTYTVGRVGAEIAYVIADNKLGLKDIILQEPSVGGRDLFTRDNTVAIQARALVNFKPGSVTTTIQEELKSLVDKLVVDYEKQPDMRDGFAILSFIDPSDGGLKGIIVEVPRQ